MLGIGCLENYAEFHELEMLEREILRFVLVGNCKCLDRFGLRVERMAQVLEDLR